jgi:hypothetical protein
MSDELFPLAIFDTDGRYLRTDMVPEHQHTDGPQQWALEHAPDVAPLRYRLATNAAGKRQFKPIAHTDNEPAENAAAGAILYDVVAAVIEVNDYGGKVKTDRLARLRRYLTSLDTVPDFDKTVGE